MNKAVFLDRDDTICKDVPYCSRPDDLILIEGAGRAISNLNNNNFLTILVTNQSGISRGYFSVSDLELIHAKLEKDLLDYGARLDDIFYCPCLPEDGCKDRKPGTGLIERAVKKHSIDASNSYIIGDRRSDIIAGSRMGLRTVLVGKKEECLDEDFFATDIRDAVLWILSDGENEK